LKECEVHAVEPRVNQPGCVERISRSYFPH
jgi:hypothetical protein